MEHICPERRRGDHQRDGLLLCVDRVLANTVRTPVLDIPGFLLTDFPSDVFNYGAPWRKCKDKRDEQSMIFAYAIICILVDCMLVALPLWVVLSYVKMGVKSIQILLIFSLGIFAVVTGIVRFVIIVTTDFNVNT